MFCGDGNERGVRLTTEYFSIRETLLVLFEMICFDCVFVQSALKSEL